MKFQLVVFLQFFGLQMLHCAQNNMEISQLLLSLLGGPHISRTSTDYERLTSPLNGIKIDTTDLLIQEKTESETIFKHYIVGTESDEAFDPVVFRRPKIEAGTDFITLSDPLYPLGSGPLLFLLKVDFLSVNKLDKGKHLYKKFHVGFSCIGCILIVMLRWSPYSCSLEVFCINPSIRNQGIGIQNFMAVTPSEPNLRKEVEEERLTPTERIQNTEILEKYRSDIGKSNDIGGEESKANQVLIPLAVAEEERLRKQPLQDMALLHNISSVQALKSEDETKLFNKTLPSLTAVTLTSDVDATTIAVKNDSIGSTLNPSSQRSMVLDQVKTSNFVEGEVPLKEEGIDNSLSISTEHTATISSITDQEKGNDDYRGGNIRDVDNKDNVSKNGFKIETEQFETTANVKTGRRAFKYDKNTSNLVQDVRMNVSNHNPRKEEENASHISFLTHQIGPDNENITEPETLKTQNNTNNKIASIDKSNYTTTNSGEHDDAFQMNDSTLQSDATVNANITISESETLKKGDNTSNNFEDESKDNSTYSVEDDDARQPNVLARKFNPVDANITESETLKKGNSTSSKSEDDILDESKDNPAYSAKEGDALRPNVSKQGFKSIAVNTTDLETLKNIENTGSTFEGVRIDESIDNQTYSAEEDAALQTNLPAFNLNKTDSETLRNGENTSNKFYYVSIDDSNETSTHSAEDVAALQFNPIKTDSKTLRNGENKLEDVVIHELNDSPTILTEVYAPRINDFPPEEKYNPIPDPSLIIESETFKDGEHPSNDFEDIAIHQSKPISINTAHLMNDSVPQRNSLISQFIPDTDITANKKKLINEENLGNKNGDVIADKSNSETSSMDHNVAQPNFRGTSNVPIPSTTLPTPYNSHNMPYQSGYNTPFNTVSTPMRTGNGNTFGNSWNADLPYRNIGNINDGYNYNNNGPWKSSGVENHDAFYSTQGRMSNQPQPYNNVAAAPLFPATQNMMPSRNIPVGPGIGSNARQWTEGNKILMDSNRNNPTVYPGMGVVTDSMPANFNRQRYYYPNKGRLDPPFANLGMRNS